MLRTTLSISEKEARPKRRLQFSNIVITYFEIYRNRTSEHFLEMMEMFIHANSISLRLPMLFFSFIRETIYLPWFYLQLAERLLLENIFRVSKNNHVSHDFVDFHFQHFTFFSSFLPSFLHSFLLSYFPSFLHIE